MRIRRALARGAALAAAVYSGYAAWTWLRYGHRGKKPQNASLDRFLLDPEVIEQNSILVDAPAGIAFETCRNFDLMHSRVAKLLFETRACAMGAKPGESDLPKSFVDQMAAVGWSILEEVPGEEIVFGVVAQPWRADAGFRTIPPAQFAAFNEQGWVKIVVNISVESAAGSNSLIRTETRVTTTDAGARKRFRKYWALASPGVKLIRVATLRAIKANAEAIVQKAAA